jgi:pimeloyl-ACP methyl ester carboxylesterase
VKAYTDIWYQSRDGLTLHARDFPHAEPRATILCLPGLTRNATDFDFICQHLSGDYRLLAAEQRGRGLSAWDPHSENYNPVTYVADMFTLLDELALPSVIVLGTSLGGFMAMLMAAMQPSRIDALIMNDIGPEIDPRGLVRIQSYVGVRPSANTWDEAMARTRALQSSELPDLSDDDWWAITRAIYRESSAGKLELAYDPAIAGPADSAKPAIALPTLWPQFELLKNKPLLLIRGATSDILSRECADKMRAVKPDMHYCEQPNRGHAPLLNEQESVRAIDAFLQAL